MIRRFYKVHKFLGSRWNLDASKRAHGPDYYIQLEKSWLLFSSENLIVILGKTTLYSFVFCTDNGREGTELRTSWSARINALSRSAHKLLVNLMFKLLVHEILVVGILFKIPSTLHIHSIMTIPNKKDHSQDLI